MTTKSLGTEGFRWFVGIVEDRNDPEQLGRVRARAYGFHGDKVDTPTEHLPWAVIMSSPTSASSLGVGISPTGIQVGSTVLGFFMDGNEMQIPVIMGTIAGKPNGKHDVSPLARGQQITNKQILGPEPSSPYGAKYPYNKVMQSESGHAIEIDDTPNNERLHTYHKAGTYSEIGPDGTRVNKIVADDFEIIQKNKTVFVQGNVNIVVKGNVQIDVDGSYDLNVAGPITINGSTVNINDGTNGAARINDTTLDDDSETNGADTGVIQTGSATVFIGG